jgi:hypothetical protein
MPVGYPFNSGAEVVTIRICSVIGTEIVKGNSDVGRGKLEALGYASVVVSTTKDSNSDQLPNPYSLTFFVMFAVGEACLNVMEARILSTPYDCVLLQRITRRKGSRKVWSPLHFIIPREPFVVLE